ncbi:hypothetical protein ACQR35_08430 [Pseudarthrobacter sp. J1738]|uniref:hypothetical protein n=1 Tax=unclassified Pseudarthrobacter TaxID=2647000 RepID=UPI003D26A154
MWSVVLMGVGGILAGGGISFMQQRKPKWLSVSFFVLAAMALLAAFLLTLPGN